jgi:hypothetical protein
MGIFVDPARLSIYRLPVPVVSNKLTIYDYRYQLPPVLLIYLSIVANKQKFAHIIGSFVTSNTSAKQTQTQAGRARQAQWAEQAGEVGQAGQVGQTGQVGQAGQVGQTGLI